MSLELGRLVQQRRHELGISRRDLADRSEMSYPYVSQIETGDRDPSLRTLRKLADVLEVPVEDLASLVAPDSWVMGATQPASAALPPPASMSPSRSRPSSRSREISYDDSVDLYRDKVLPSLERKLQSVPPLVRLELLAELTRRAAREAAEQP